MSGALPELPGLTHELREDLRRYADEVVRWNRSINLVSRRDPERRVADLVSEAVLSWQAFRDQWSNAGDLFATPWCYVDLGSGGGFPGLVWSLLFLRGEWPGRRPERLFLVEPREKRVAFLERQVRLMNLPKVQILPSAWNSIPVGYRQERLPQWAVITMKALALTDDKVREGWRQLTGHEDASRVFLVRFSGHGSKYKTSGHQDIVSVLETGTELVITALT